MECVNVSVEYVNVSVECVNVSVEYVNVSVEYVNVSVKYVNVSGFACESRKFAYERSSASRSEYEKCRVPLPCSFPPTPSLPVSSLTVHEPVRLL